MPKTKPIGGVPRLMLPPPVTPGNGLDESLLSYVLRLSELNCVKPSTFIFSVASSANIPIGLQSLPDLRWLNGANSVGTRGLERFAEALSLKANQSVPATTFASLCSDPEPRRFLAWAPRHLAYHKSQYYPLLWQHRSIRVCPGSKTALHSLCHQCGWPQKVRGTKMRVGQCVRCEAQFEEASDHEPAPWDPIASEIADFGYELWAAEQVCQLIVHQAKTGITEPFLFGDTLLWWLITHGYSVQKHGGLLGYDLEEVPYLLGEDHSEPLNRILESCWKLEIGILEFIARRVPDGWKGLQEERLQAQVLPAPREHLTKTAIAHVVNDLRQILEQSMYRHESLIEICHQRLGIGTEAAYLHCPEIACKLTERFLRTGRATDEVRESMADWEGRQSSQDQLRGNGGANLRT